jgi:hypothetical protein
MDPLTAKLKEARWNLLEKFSRVTAFGRRAANDILEQPIVKDHIIPHLPPQMREIVKSKEVQRYAGEYDSAREYLARWAAGVAEESERQRGKRGEEVGSIWGSSSRHSGWEEVSELGGFEVLSVLHFFFWVSGFDFRLRRPREWRGRRRWMRGRGKSSLITRVDWLFLQLRLRRLFFMG